MMLVQCVVCDLLSYTGGNGVDGCYIWLVVQMWLPGGS